MDSDVVIADDLAEINRDLAGLDWSEPATEPHAILADVLPVSDDAAGYRLCRWTIEDAAILRRRLARLVRKVG